MSLFKNIREVFTRKKAAESAEEVPVELAPAESGAQPLSADVEPPGNVVHIHSHGFTNGVFRVEPDKEGFERFLEFYHRSDRIREQQVLNRKAIAGVAERLDRVRSAYGVDGEIVVEKERVAGNLSVSIGELEQERVKKEQEAAGFLTRREETHAEYSWVPALLFLVAGCVFIAADISISQQITSWGFNMPVKQGWIFAFALAFTAFLIKPAIDRMLEKPFQTSGFKLKNVYRGVLLGITALGLLMLWFLGNFRSDSERADKKLKSLSQQMETFDPRSAQHQDLQVQYDKIQHSLDENVMGRYGLVLSGVLFAIGGAICLSISFGSLKQLINRYWILPAWTRQRRRAITALNKKISEARAEHTLLKTEQEKAEKRIQASELIALQEELVKLRTEEVGLLTEFHEAEYERERALYLDGRNRGEKYTLDGELLYRTSGSDRSPLYVGKQGGTSEVSPSESVRPYTRRPFVKMRKMIADHLNKNQKNPSYDDGTEFEIVS